MIRGFNQLPNLGKDKPHNLNDKSDRSASFMTFNDESKPSIQVNNKPQYYGSPVIAPSP